jgi:hypothetical protein
MNDFNGLYNIRDFREGDRNFIMSTFLRGLYYGESQFSEIPKDIFMKHYWPFGMALLNSKNLLVKVACLPDDPDTIIGYSILTPNLDNVVFVFVKGPWRQKGVAKSLVPANPKHVGHLTKLGRMLLSKLGNPSFNPFIYP